jgi:molybdopterin-binding protein
VAACGFVGETGEGTGKRQNPSWQRHQGEQESRRMPREYYSVSEAAKTLGISVDTLRRWDRQGRIKAERDGSNRRIVPASEIERLRGEPGLAHLSARNRFNAIVTDVKIEGLMAQVEMVVSDPVRLIALVTRDAVEELELRPGMSATAIVKSTSVMVQH